MRRLPIIRYHGIDYFVDERLQEFRSNARPIEFIPFNSKKGRIIQQFIGGK